MSAVHVIRLRDPWEVQALPDGSTQYRRKFGQPRLGSGEAVWLVCPEGYIVHLNGEPVPSTVEVTSRLLPRNELLIVPNIPPVDVRLEIRSSP